MKLLIALFLLISVNSYAGDIEGVAYTEVMVNGVAYQVPLANNEYKQKIYFLKRALNGDREALDMMLEGWDENMLYIGDDVPMWVKFDRQGKFEVIPEDSGTSPAKLGATHQATDGAKPSTSELDNI